MVSARTTSRIPKEWKTGILKAESPGSEFWLLHYPATLGTRHVTGHCAFLRVTVRTSRGFVPLMPHSRAPRVCGGFVVIDEAWVLECVTSKCCGRGSSCHNVIAPCGRRVPLPVEPLLLTAHRLLKLKGTWRLCSPQDVTDEGLGRGSEWPQPTSLLSPGPWSQAWGLLRGFPSRLFRNPPEGAPADEMF